MISDWELIIYTDGGARGNPGPAAVGVAVYGRDDKLIGKHSKYLGIATNNQAEYQGVIYGLEIAKRHNGSKLKFYLDSELVVNQLNLKYKIKDRQLSTLFVKIWNAKNEFLSVEFFHIPREKNKVADKLVNLCLDEQSRV